MSSNQLTLHGILRDGKTVILTEDTQLPEHLPDVPVQIRVELLSGPAVIRNGKTLVLEGESKLSEPSGDLPVLVHIKLPVGIGLLQVYGSCKDEDFEAFARDLEVIRYGRPLREDER